MTPQVIKMFNAVADVFVAINGVLRWHTALLSVLVLWNCALTVLLAMRSKK